MSEQTDLLKEVVKKLEEVDIRYMISGSIASSYFAQPRMTRDIDIVVELSLLNAESLIQSFSNEYYIDELAVRDAISRTSQFNVIHLATMIKIDFIVRKDTSYRATEFQRRQRVTIDNESIWFVTPEDLILSKLIWAFDSRSEIQLNDVRTMIDDVETLDWSYIEYWANQLELVEMLNEVRL